MKRRTHAPRPQTAPTTPPSRREDRTGRPAKGRKLAMPPAPQPIPQNTRRGKGVYK